MFQINFGRIAYIKGFGKSGMSLGQLLSSSLSGAVCANKFCRGAFSKERLLACTCAFLMAGCFGRSITKPHSQAVEEATNRGEKVLTSEQENKRFLAYERQNMGRVVNLLKKRVALGGTSTAYRVGIADTLQFSVFDLPEFNAPATVNEAGIVTLPLIGAVKVTGLSIDSVRALVAEKLAKYVKLPQVIVTVTEFGSQKVAVLGAVEKPGAYPLKKGVNSLTELLGEAGGAGQRAGNFVNFMPVEWTGLSSENDASSRAQLALQSLTKPTAADISVELAMSNLMGTSGGLPLEIPVRGGDVIVVQEAGKVSVDGEVEKRGAYDVVPGMTLLGALGSAGGISYSAKIDEIELIRNVGGKVGKLRRIVDIEKIVSGNEPDILLRSGDIVRVPSDSGRRMTEDTYENISRILNFGVGGSVNLIQ